MNEEIIKKVRAKKSLGQNWLKSESAIKEIIKAADLKEGEEVLEIGPGRGALTKELIKTGAKVLAIEKDDELLDELLEKFANEINDKKLFIAHGDILELNASKLFVDKNYKLVANIPYYITGQIIRKFLSEEENQPTLMILMLQKEVAERIVAKPRKTRDARHGARESLLSISVKVYGTPKYIKTVPAGAFEPKPKVDSAILLIENISKNFFASNEEGTEKNISETEFFKLLKKGFGQKRKLLRGNLRPRPAEVASREALAKWDKKIHEIFKICNIPIKARAENLTLENWRCLAEKI